MIIYPPYTFPTETVKPPRPDDTADVTYDCDLAYVGDVPTVTWVARPTTPDEKFQFNERTIRDQAEAALALNATFLALATPTNAQVLAQVRLLTQENNKIIRLLLGRLEETT